MHMDQAKIYNPGHNILALFNNLAQVRIATSKTILDIHHEKLDICRSHS